MPKPIFTSLAPNTEADDVWLALKLLIQLWKWRIGDSRALLENTFRKWLGTNYAFAFESGRSALFAILSCLDLCLKDEVLLQAYTCVAVPNAVLWAGAKPVYVDIEQDSFNMSPHDLEKKISPRSKVLIIQHTFGLPVDIENLLALAKKHNLFVIEDCAHALGAQYHEKKVGTFSNAAFFSFGRDKVISSVFGGMAVTNDEKLSIRIRRFHENCKFSSRLWIFQQLLHPIITSIIKITYNFGNIGKIILGLARHLHIISKAVYGVEKKGEKPAFVPGKMPNALAKLALHQFAKLDRFNDHRQEIAKIYGDGIQSSSLKLPFEKEGLRHIFLRYTIRSVKVAEVLVKAKKEKIFLGNWYSKVIAPKGVDYSKIGYEPKFCPVAEKIASESLNLPTDIHIGEEEALRIVYFLQKNL